VAKVLSTSHNPRMQNAMDGRKNDKDIRNVCSDNDKAGNSNSEGEVGIGEDNECKKEDRNL
jgi:hypothetical protein